MQIYTEVIAAVILFLSIYFAHLLSKQSRINKDKKEAMPRWARLKSSTGYHHIMLKGIMRSNIFENNQDEPFFLNLIYRARGKR